MKRLSRFFAFGIVLATLSACGNKAPIASTGVVELAESSSLPQPSAADYRRNRSAYLAGPLDQVRIEVLGVGELSREIQIDASGQFEFPLIGTIDASGKSPSEIAREIERRLAGQYVRDPQVTVNLLETVSQNVTVDGEVVTPGLYPVTNNMTLMRAVASAEGLDEFADVEDVVVFRTVGGQRYAALYNLGAIRRGNYEDPEIFANDIVVVGDSNSRKLFDTILSAAPLITTPILILLRN